jgi:hypothetical protein
LDWEESLWSTDLNNYDTDNDGTPDGEEVKLKRDPTIAGPNDLIVDQKEKILSEIGSSVDNNSLSTEVTKQFIENYFALKESNDALTQDQKTNLLQQLEANTVNQATIIPPYTIENIKTFSITPENKKERITIYYTQLVRILSEFEQVSNNTSNSGQFSIEKDLEMAENIKSLSLELFQIETPSEIAREHLSISNNLYIIGQSIYGFHQEENDPLYAFYSVSQFSNAREIMAINLEKIIAFIKEGDIINNI